MTGPPTKPDAAPIECSSLLYHVMLQTAKATRVCPSDQIERIVLEELNTYLYGGKPPAAGRVTAFDLADWRAIWTEFFGLKAEVEYLRNQKAPEPDVGKRSLRGEDAKPTRR